jgi:hypothetical protein
MNNLTTILRGISRTSTIILLTSLISTNVFSHTLTSCLVGNWSFNGNANDESGNANHGTVHGATLTTDRFGNTNSAYSFDGVDDYIEVADAASLDFEGDGTLSFWVKQEGDVGTILWKRAYAGSNGWTAYFGFSNSMIGYVNDNATWVQGSTISSQWQHIALVSAQGTMKLYINGSLADSKNNANGFQATAVSLLIGNDENNNYFEGIIDDIGIYNCALNASEIVSLYNGTPDCLVSYWPFNSNANDESGTDNHGHVHGATVTTDRFGNPGSAYSFDGIDDYIEVLDASSLDFEGDGTLSFWVKQNGDAGPVLWKKLAPGNNGWATYFGFSNTMIGYVNDNATWVQGSTTSSPWQHVALVSDQGTMKLYIDGTLVDSKSNANGFQATDISLLIGKDENNNYFEGTIDDIRIHNCALNANQIAILYNNVTLGINNSYYTNDLLEIYPNPAKDKIKIIDHNNISQETFVTIINNTGQPVSSATFENPALIEIDVHDYAKGVYLVRLQTGDIVTTKKFVVQ